MFVSFVLGLIAYVWELARNWGFLWQYEWEAALGYLWGILCLSVLSLGAGIGVGVLWRDLKRSIRNN